MSKKVAVIILAAGKSTRMKSDIPKVLHPICGRPMVEYVTDTVKAVKPQRIVAVLGYKHQEVRKYFPPGVKVALQQKLLGTADAVKAGLRALGGFRGAVLVLYGDTPLLKTATIKELLKRHFQNNSDATLLTAKLDSPEGYGRILRDSYGSICSIIEEKDADDFQKAIKEINTGIACFDNKALALALKSVRPNNKKREYYLTDAVGLIYGNGGLIYNLAIARACEAMGVNSRLDLSRANHMMQLRLNEEIMRSGVTIVNTDTTVVEYGVSIGEDTVIYPFTVIERDVKIGRHCRIGPFAHLRPGTRLADSVAIGNFAEVSRSVISGNTIMKHFGYIGDSRIGREVNIGAGAVTANFDGSKKHLTVVKDKAFIGSDTVFIAPLEIGRGAKTGAGAVITRNTNVRDYEVVAGVPAKVIKKSGKRKQNG
ncbi:MAG: NTP transferase domain-containing protein [Candidatus Omnitrophota bacterium]